MISLVFGALAALFWGIQNVMLAGRARQLDPSAIALRYVGYMALLALPVALATTDFAALHPDEVTYVALGGIGQGAGMLCFTRALDKGPVGPLTGLLSLEGAGAALLSMLAGEALGIPLAIGLLVASAGGVMLVSASSDSVPRQAFALTIFAVGANALGLWLLGLNEVSVPLSLCVFNTASALSILIYLAVRGGSPFVGTFSTARGELFMVATSALGASGLAAFTIGAQEGSTAITAVLGAQFASVAAIGGYFAFKERMAPRQLVGFAVLIAGVSIIAGFA